MPGTDSWRVLSSYEMSGTDMRRISCYQPTTVVRSRVPSSSSGRSRRGASSGPFRSCPLAVYRKRCHTCSATGGIYGSALAFILAPLPFTAAVLALTAATLTKMGADADEKEHAGAQELVAAAVARHVTPPSCTPRNQIQETAFLCSAVDVCARAHRDVRCGCLQGRMHAVSVCCAHRRAFVVVVFLGSEIEVPGSRRV
eukprot:1349479-Rhodomonas_salina.4